jgi:aryl-alcohol dehydrogenase-like predicted oxidoreductase
MAGMLTSSVGVGTGGIRHPPTSDRGKRAEQALALALVGGVNVIDTPTNNGWQHAERSVGRVLRGLVDDGRLTRDQVLVCSKGGYLAGPYDTTSRDLVSGGLCVPDDIVGDGHCLAPAFLWNQLRRSRENLGLDTVDVYLLHNVEEQLVARGKTEGRRRICEALAVLHEAVERGWIGRYGVASAEGFRRPGPEFHPLDDLLGLARTVAGHDHCFDVVQVPVNLLMTEALFSVDHAVDGARVSLLEAACYRGISVMASASVASGRRLPIPPALRAACPPTWTDTQVGLQFVRSLPHVSTALIGMTNPAHVTDNLAVCGVPPIDLTEPAD